MNHIADSTKTTTATTTTTTICSRLREVIILYTTKARIIENGLTNNIGGTVEIHMRYRNHS